MRQGKSDVDSLGNTIDAIVQVPDNEPKPVLKVWQYMAVHYHAKETKTPIATGSWWPKRLVFVIHDEYKPPFDSWLAFVLYDEYEARVA